MSDTVATTPSGAPASAETTPERYVLLDRLGEGGMGVVWKAHDRVLDRSIALKLLHDRFLGAEHQARLAAEARAMARLTHPNIVAVYDVGEREGRTYLTMELVKGENLSRWLETPRGWREVIAMFRAAGEGLAAAHAAGVLHRDIKPSNLLVGEDGRVRVADFGVATTALAGELDAEATATASIAGTPAYMAPERLDGQPSDARSDQFSFAVALWEALHGKRPFEAATVPALREAMQHAPKSPSRAVPARVQRVVERALSRDPAARFPSIGAMVAALAPPRRWPWLAGTGVIAAGVAVFALTRPGPNTPPCQGAEHQLDGTWDDTARARLRAAAGEAAAAAVEPGFDRYAADWTATWTDACRAARVDGSQDGGMYAHRLTCLSIARRVLGEAVDRVARLAPDDLDVAPEIVRFLPPIRACSDLETLARGGDDRYLFTTTRAISTALQTADERLHSKDIDGAARAAERAIAMARAASDAGGEGAGLVFRARIELARGDAEIGLATLDDAERIAIDAGAAEVRVDVKIARALCETALGRYDAAETHLDEAYAALLRQGDLVREYKVSRARIGLFRTAGRHADAVREINRTRKLDAALWIDHDLELDIVTAEEELATGNVADARTHAGTARALLVAQYGEHNPVSDDLRTRIDAVLAHAQP